ncbi:Gfo/Idh/MocA family oxidoreductase [Desulfococcaceae bacterium HSG9]|nr:Gfo/Idh/MocA family oxidoreductase [Desulfococcaceae bacterium HSG9]
MHKSNIAVIGSGYWGKNLIRSFHQLGTLKLICDKNEILLRQFKEQYPDIEVSMSFGDILERNDIHAIVIATPAETHFTLAREALQAGKHVFVEKPVALKEKDGKILVELAEQNDLILMVGHILQYHPAVLKLKHLIDSGYLGKIRYLYSNRLNLGKIRVEENILWSFAPHDISVILMLLGEMPESVYASGGAYLQQQIPDTTLTILDFPSGVKAHIFVSWLHPFKEQKLIVVGDEKMAVFDDVSLQKLTIYPHKIDWVERMPVASKANAEFIDVDMQEPLKAECLHFLECIGSGKQPRTDGREGLRVLQILEASQLSINKTAGNHIRLESPVSQTSQLSFEQKQVTKYFAHESACLDDNIEIGSGTKIWHFSHILSGSSIGENCNIGQNAVIGPDVFIGDGCKIQNNVSVYKGVTLEDGVFCGPSMVFTNVNNPRAEIRKMNQFRPTLVKKGATIGANATIVCGVILGRYCFIGAGSVANKNVADHALVVGNPGKQIGWVCVCGERLTDDLECPSCGKKFDIEDNKVLVCKS